VISQLQPQQMRDSTPPGINPVDYMGGQPAGGGINPNCRRWIYRSESTTSARPDSEPLSTLNPELPFTEIVRQEFVDDSLQQARLVMVWRVPGLNQRSNL